MTWLIAVFVRPMVYFVIFVTTGYLVVRPIRRYMKDGKLKRFLLTDVSGDANGRRLRQLWLRLKQPQDRGRGGVGGVPRSGELLPRARQEKFTHPDTRRRGRE